MVLMTEAFVRKGQDIQQKFFNRMQRMGMAIAAHDEYWVCSRGTGTVSYTHLTLPTNCT